MIIDISLSNFSPTAIISLYQDEEIICSSSASEHIRFEFNIDYSKKYTLIINQIDNTETVVESLIFDQHWPNIRKITHSGRLEPAQTDEKNYNNIWFPGKLIYKLIFPIIRWLEPQDDKLR